MAIIQSIQHYMTLFCLVGLGLCLVPLALYAFRTPIGILCCGLWGLVLRKAVIVLAGIVVCVAAGAIKPDSPGGTNDTQAAAPHATERPIQNVVASLRYAPGDILESSAVCSISETQTATDQICRDSQSEAGEDKSGRSQFACADLSGVALAKTEGFCVLNPHPTWGIRGAYSDWLTLGIS